MRHDSSRTAVRKLSSPKYRPLTVTLASSDWLQIQAEAARQGIPMTALCRQWLRPSLNELGERSEKMA